MRSPIAMIALVVAVAPFSFAQTLDAPFAFSLSSSLHGLSAHDPHPVVKLTSYGLGDIPDSAIAATLRSVAAARLRSARRYAPLSLPPEFSDDYYFDPFPIFAIPPKGFSVPSALGPLDFVPPIW
jgi:hypothetical protein